MSELAKIYNPAEVEAEIYDAWLATGAFAADPADERDPFCMVIPPPNVTAALHLGHALNNTLQDVLVRYKRMAQFATLWMPGTDHAGIATQTVVEKRLLAEEGKRRTDFEREDFVSRVQAWKDEYEATILGQLKRMGCSCDWDRTRFTMDDVCAKAVRETFFRLFSDGLIYRGKRLVNWDPATQTVLADDEVEHEEIHGHFYYLQYPLVEAVEIPRDASRAVASDAGFQPASPEGILPSADVHQREGRYLPHWTQQGAVYAITFRLADSVSADVRANWRRERDEIHSRAEAQNRELTHAERKQLHLLHAAKVESYLDAGQGECLLRSPAAADIVAEALRHFDGERYRLVAWSVMPNHVHVIVQPCGEHGLAEIVHSWKSFTANKINEALRRTGPLWQDEYYDHLIRDDEDFVNQVNYAYANPEKAGLEKWNWRWQAELAGGALPKGPGDEDRRQDACGTRGLEARDTGDTGATTTITHITVATTRPETMLGDTAIAMNPSDPRAKALVGKMVRLPIVGREIPIIADDHVVLPNPESDDEKAKFSTGFLKVTPAHDPDDYQIGQRHNLPILNVMAPDGSIDHRFGWDDWDEIKNPDVENIIGMDRFEARKAIVGFFRSENLLEDVRDYVHQVGHSYRSHVPIEPYLSDQWYVAVKKPIPGVEHAMTKSQLRDEQVEKCDGEAFYKGTDVPVDSLAGLALMPVLDGRVRFVPERYARTYQTWLENLRDWPISRQLWWGHRIPVWSAELELPADVAPEATDRGPDAQVCAALDKAAGGNFHEMVKAKGKYFLRVGDHPEKAGWILAHVCPGPDSEGIEKNLEAAGFVQDSDVLDTWFSSALWPFSTLGWPEETPQLKKFFPGSVLSTAREIITLWVSRMVMMGQYCVGDIPFSDVFIHAMIQDGEGRKMSKSLGNGVDPLDIISSHGADAMRYTLVSMTTQTQDVRMPLEKMTLPDGRDVNSSRKFDVGRNLCTKLWNGSRFVLGNLLRTPKWSEVHPTENLADAWILSRLNTTIRDATAALDEYRFNELADKLYHFFWDDFCDWYVEIAKVRIHAGDRTPKVILAHTLGMILRLFHPVMPYITEAIWAKLSEVAPLRGPGDSPAEDMLVLAQWPRADGETINPASEAAFETLADMIRQIRNVRMQHNVVPSLKIAAIADAIEGLPETTLLQENELMVRELAGLGELRIEFNGIEPPAKSAAIAAGGVKLYLLDIVDSAAERSRLEKQAATLEKGIAGVQGKLGNENFVSKAPANVVQRETRRLEEMQRDLTAVKEALASLGG